MKQHPLLSFLICLALLAGMFPVGGHTEANGDLSLIDYEDMGTVLDACMANEQLYILSTLGIYRFSRETMNDPMEKILDLAPFQRSNLTPWAPESAYDRALWEQGVGLLFSAEGEIYGLHPYTGQVSRLEGDSMKPLSIIPEDQFYYTDQGERKCKEVINIFSARRQVYLVLSSFTYEQGDVRQLYTWDMTAPAMREIEIDGLKAASPGPAEQILVAVEDAAGGIISWRTFDLRESSPGNTIHPEGETVYGPAIAPDSLHPYYFGPENTVWERLPDGTEIQKSFLPVKNARLSDHAFMMDEQHYVYVNDGLYIRDVSGIVSADRPRLNVLGMMDERAAQFYTAQHPGVSVSIDNRIPGFLELQESILSRDSGVDIYILDTAGFYADALDKGYTEPLDDHPLLKELSEQLYPVIREALSKDGRLMAFPLSITPYIWTLNRSQWETLNMGEYPATLEETLERARQWKEEKADEYPDHTFLDTNVGLDVFLSGVVFQYLMGQERIDAPANFDTHVFRSAIDCILRHRDLFDDPNIVSYPLIMPYTTGSFGILYFDSDEAITILPPGLDTTSPRLCGASMNLMVVNPLSKHKDIAKDFIASCAQQMSTQTQYTLYQSKNEPLKYERYEESLSLRQAEIQKLEELISKAEGAEKTELESRLAFEQSLYQQNLEHVWEISPEWIDIKEATLSNMVIPLRAIFMNSFYSERDQAIQSALNVFTGGNMTIDVLINQLNSIARLQYAENRD